MTFYGEWAPFDTDEEKEEAYEYLRLWKKFMLKKLGNRGQVGNDSIILRNYDIFTDSKFKMTLGIKIQVEDDNVTAEDQEATQSA